jgi:chemotaxis protein methyltransferase CheR
MAGSQPRVVAGDHRLMAVKRTAVALDQVTEPAWPYRITDAEFALFQALVQQETGIQLPEVKRPLLVGRLARRIRELKLESFGDYYKRVTIEGDQAERTRLFDRIATNETHFFREPKHFDFLEQRIVPAWLAAADARGRRVRVWSAACSTGEEPFSIAMTLLTHLKGWEIDILATDLSSYALERAQSAMWPIEKAGEIPEPHLKAFMLRGTGANASFMKAGPEVRAVVRFARVNLHDGQLPAEAPFDVIFCRNVLIYFSAEGRATVVNKLIDRLAPGGCFFVGHAESLSGITDRLRVIEPTIYSAGGRTMS